MSLPTYLPTYLSVPPLSFAFSGRWNNSQSSCPHDKRRDGQSMIHNGCLVDHLDGRASKSDRRAIWLELSLFPRTETGITARGWSF